MFVPPPSTASLGSTWFEDMRVELEAEVYVAVVDEDVPADLAAVPLDDDDQNIKPAALYNQYTGATAKDKCASKSAIIKKICII